MVVPWREIPARKWAKWGSQSPLTSFARGSSNIHFGCGAAAAMSITVCLLLCPVQAMAIVDVEAVHVGVPINGFSGAATASFGGVSGNSKQVPKQGRWPSTVACWQVYGFRGPQLCLRQESGAHGYQQGIRPSASSFSVRVRMVAGRIHAGGARRIYWPGQYLTGITAGF